MVFTKFLNLGCGNRFHPDWTNINCTSTNVDVIAHDLTQGIPFPDESFDVVYHSHLLEHFPKSQAPLFVQECYRVLRHQGIVRIAVPDLEQIIRSYILVLEQALSSPHEDTSNYTWILLELFDQSIRNQSGGDMATYLHQVNIPNEAFILKRLGAEAKNLIAAGQRKRKSPDPWFKCTLRPAYDIVRNPRDTFLRLLLGSADYQALKIGRFRQSGEIHQWMYDRYSLRRLLEISGFMDIIQRSAGDSYIPNWTKFNLDTEPDGSVYKPDSLFMEAVKSD